jgi:hypothetical protein
VTAFRSSIRAAKSLWLQPPGDFAVTWSEFP